MLRKEQRNSIIEICPVRNVIARFGNKWALLVILILSEHEKIRFNELRQLIPDISSRVLSGTLKTLETDALVLRTTLSDCSSKSRISTDGIRAVARTYHNPTDRMGTDKLENNSHAPKRVRGKASGRIGSIFQKEYQLSSCRL